MQKDIPPVFIAGIVIVVLGLVVFGAIKAMAPHEKVVKTQNTGMVLPPAMQQKMLAMRQRAMANRAVVSTTATH